MKYDFGGWATKNNLKCGDGRVICKDAFKVNDGQIVPLVWNHKYDSPSEVLGHALLENRKDGVYAYCSFNNTETGQIGKELVKHGDVTSLSIYANRLKQNGPNVMHGVIREVSLVHAGANPGARIDDVAMAHGEDAPVDEAIICVSEPIDGSGDIELKHSDKKGSDEEKKEEIKEEPKENKEEKRSDEMSSEDKTVGEVFDTLTEEQKTAVYAIIGAAIEGNEEEGDNVKHNIFDNEYEIQNGELTHSEMETIMSDAKRFGSLSESFLQHADEYGIMNIDYLNPDYKNVTPTPEFIKRDNSWVSEVMSDIHHTPWSRIKSMFADITADDARAKGYVKGNLKKEEVFSLLKRTTDPTTVYKKQKIDRDDVIDITDLDVLAWIKTEMRMMLDEELARAYVFGDGRNVADEDKIDETHIRPIYNDSDLFTIKVSVPGANDSEIAENMVDYAVSAQDEYEGSGSLKGFIKKSWVTKMLLLKDRDGHRMYKTVTELATAMSLSKIVSVPDSIVPTGYYGVIVDLRDYNVGADKGGSINMFDDFDIDYNQQKYLIETRCSGALTKPKSAIALKVASQG